MKDRKPKDFADEIEPYLDPTFCGDYEGHGAGIGFVVVVCAVAGALMLAAFFAW